MSIDPVQLEIVRHALLAVTDEMGQALMRTGFSPNIKERRDYSCAIFDTAGQAIAQGDHMPVHLGSMPAAVAAVLRDKILQEDDIALVNDPYRGGTHLPDLTIVMPVYLSGAAKPAFFVANRAHHADVGGMTPGSMGIATDIIQEGLRIPPVLLVRGGVEVPDTWTLLLANMRASAERRGDLDAQIASLRVGAQRLQEAVGRFGLPELRRYADALLDHSERLTQAALRQLKPGSHSFRDAMDGPHLIEGIVDVLPGGRLRVDLRSCADQVEAPINAPRAVTLSAVAYAVRCIAGADAPWNGGTMRPVQVLTRPGSLLDARSPAPVAGGNVETSQRVVDVVLGALAAALPDRIPAASQGTMNNLCLGGRREDGRRWAYYETIAGGSGGGPRRPGADGIHTHMTNSLNTPIEALEHQLPLRVREYRLRPESGGSGRHPGGRGVIRELEVLSAAELTLLSDRRSGAPYGLAGGGPGSPGRAEILRVDGSRELLGGRTRAQLRAGDRVRVETPGGGGWGPP